MPKKTKAEFAKLKFGDTWFAQSHLTTEEIMAYEHWAVENDDDLPEYLNELVGSYHSIKLSFDDYNDCYTASCTCMASTSDNYAGIMTARSDNPYDALTMVIYKVTVLYANQPWSKVAERSIRG